MQRKAPLLLLVLLLVPVGHGAFHDGEGLHDAAAAEGADELAVLHDGNLLDALLRKRFERIFGVGVHVHRDHVLRGQGLFVEHGLEAFLDGLRFEQNAEDLVFLA